MLSTDFKAYGISQANMLEQLKKLEDGLSTFIPENDVVEDKIQATRTCIEMARDMVGRTFAAVGR